MFHPPERSLFRNKSKYDAARAVITVVTSKGTAPCNMRAAPFSVARHTARHFWLRAKGASYRSRLPAGLESILAPVAAAEFAAADM
jgi:hypothetical protein